MKGLKVLSKGKERGKAKGRFNSIRELGKYRKNKESKKAKRRGG